MARYPTRVLSSLAALITVIACAHRPGQAPAPQAEAQPSPGSTVTTDDPARRGATSIDQLLAGKLTGVTVTEAGGGGIVVRMVGPTSFFSGQEPLFVIDGVPTDVTQGRLNFIDPHDIEYIRAYKDPIHTSMYGVRGANGVIEIKTKGSH
ncbi:MAG TPA: TonB-dependent receptor plug domain-containing protein [Gemmatimonadales bacterium]|nr:TonB-dependent receptor plug domain-containing protein [Gemmatimonadales bacterium]